ncbi:MAG: hypothetical protein A2Z64_02685 [Betaproteobacteria bacterium RIFCSPLOWO2_02_67_12]|nr:MAG: hypothetical protein A2Z64_02685 [Betaproteobacteria bacterium RIFCSPLOWO2_02_67_12]OGA30938.1 MAG: hypothetical protein A3I65_08790 [Betaproteobacteria bacterium RIFCSPLOWO2_02_FULL_68_150]
MPSTRAEISYRSWGLALCATGALLSATAAGAANRGGLPEAQRIYQQDRAACISGETNQDRATCLREAGAALQEARRRGLDDGDAEFERNRLLRCDRQPPEDRPDCVRRMNGEGFTSGSVEGGGIYRELVVPVVPRERN